MHQEWYGIYGWQEEERLVVYSDSEWAGCRSTASGGGNYTRIALLEQLVKHTEDDNIDTVFLHFIQTSALRFTRSM